MGSGWLVKVLDNNYLEAINFVYANKVLFSPREYFLNNKFDKESCKNSWNSLIEGLK